MERKIAWQREVKQIGYLGQARAKNYLEQQNWSFVCENWTMRGGEIDLVFYDNQTLVFVEVKTSLAGQVEHAYDLLSPKQLYNLQKASEYYVSKHNLSLDYRWDFIHVTLDLSANNVLNLEHYRDIFEL